MNNEWVAGLLEGEGYFGMHQSKRHKSPLIHCGMTDKDVVERVAEEIGANINGPYRVNMPRHKPMYVARISGVRALGIMTEIYPLMGERRRAAIQKCLEAWEHSPVSLKKGAPCRTTK